MSASPLDNLELQAVEQRNQLHHTATELKGKMQETREKLDIRRNAREHFAAMGIAATILGLAAGYGVTSLFTNE